MKPKCPKCGSDNVLYVILGMPTNEGWDMINRGIATTSGCIVTEDDKNSMCKACGHEFDHEWKFDKHGNLI